VNPLVSGLGLGFGLEVIAAYAAAVRFEGPAASIQLSWGLASDPGVGWAAWRIWSSSPDDREVDPAVPPPGMEEMRCSRLRRRDSRSCVCCCLREDQNTNTTRQVRLELQSPRGTESVRRDAPRSRTPLEDRRIMRADHSGIRAVLAWYGLICAVSDPTHGDPA
jgi:hypothetical protein